MYSGEPAGELMRVAVPAEAAAALRAAEAARLFDTRRAAWAMLHRALRIGPILPWIYLLLTEGSAGDGLTPALWGLLVLLLVMIPGEYLLERRAGAEPWVHWGWYVLLVLTLIGLVVAAAWWRPWLLAPTTVLAAIWVLAPLRHLRRAGPPAPWPPGSEGFATLSVLARASWVHPRRLAELTTMPEPVSRQWVTELSRRGLASYGGFWSGGSSRTGVQITSAGREQVVRWRADLEELAAS
ncbi:MAG: hypothetical protein ACRCZD_18655 [Phycicoccus sp.]